MDEKYVVFKREEWDRYFERTAGGHSPSGRPMPIEDAHVIREQDIFASGVFFTYAAAVQTAMEVLEANGTPAPEYLHTAHDHFMSAGEAASKSAKKFPD